MRWNLFKTTALGVAQVISFWEFYEQEIAETVAGEGLTGEGYKCLLWSKDFALVLLWETGDRTMRSESDLSKDWRALKKEFLVHVL